MIKLIRPKTPIWLQENYKKWGKKWEENHKNKQPWKWFSYQNEQVNHLLLPELKKMSQNHCAFCDAYPMGRIPNTIEHFRPKSKYPLLAYTWENLFLCCGNCQQKGEKYDKHLLKPDKNRYHFDNYFIYNFATGEIEPNPAKSEEHQQCAKITIEIYQLNKDFRNEDRRQEYQRFINSKTQFVEDFAYRFMFY